MGRALIRRIRCLSLAALVVLTAAAIVSSKLGIGYAIRSEPPGGQGWFLGVSLQSGRVEWLLMRSSSAHIRSKFDKRYAGWHAAGQCFDLELGMPSVISGTELSPYDMKNGTYQLGSVPLWLPWAGLALLTMPLLAIRRGRRSDPSCRQCNYDLTGNTSGICPECGTKVEAASPGRQGQA